VFEVGEEAVHAFSTDRFLGYRLVLSHIWNLHLVGQAVFDDLGGFTPPNEHSKVFDVIVERDRNNIFVFAFEFPLFEEVAVNAVHRLDPSVTNIVHEVLGWIFVGASSSVFDRLVFGFQEVSSRLVWMDVAFCHGWRPTDAHHSGSA